MFSFKKETNWNNNLKDKMITFIDLYRKEYKEPIKDIKYKKDYQNSMIYVFENVEITFHYPDASDIYWIAISVEVDSDNKSYFDNRYEFIKNAIENLKEND